MLESKGYPNRLGPWGWIGGARWGPDRYLYSLHRITGLLPPAAYRRHAGHEQLNDAERLAHDPVPRQVVGHRAEDAQAASTSQKTRFEN